VDQRIGDCDRLRWLAYFDLLGVKALLAAGQEGSVFNAYWAAQHEFKNHREWAPELKHAWLSDKFIILAEDDSPESFERLEYMSRLFAGSLLRHNIPLRGAVACDRFFADFDQRMFFGRALVEAYEFGEGQDWIGLLICPTAVRRIEALGLGGRLSRYYRPVEVPWKRRPQDAPSTMLACVLGSWMHVNGGNPVVDSLEAMSSRCANDGVRGKYTRTIGFLKSHSDLNG
jgi:hypothetical protein